MLAVNIQRVPVLYELWTMNFMLFLLELLFQGIQGLSYKLCTCEFCWAKTGILVKYAGFLVQHGVHMVQTNTSMISIFVLTGMLFVQYFRPITHTSPSPACPCRHLSLSTATTPSPPTSPPSLQVFLLRSSFYQTKPCTCSCKHRSQWRRSWRTWRVREMTRLLLLKAR